VSVFLLTLGENLGFYCAEAASRFLIQDFMLETFDQGIIPALNLLMRLLNQADEDLYDMIESGSFGQPTFTLSWILTWFAHDIENFSQVQRIYDACLSQHPLFTLYLSVSLILLNKERVLEHFDEDDPQTSLFIVFQRIGPQIYSIDTESLITKAKELLDKCPPD
jgi:lipid-A-disaccharide synthase-like uncharacterized protein